MQQASKTWLAISVFFHLFAAALMIYLSVAAVGEFLEGEVAAAAFFLVIVVLLLGMLVSTAKEAGTALTGDLLLLFRKGAENPFKTSPDWATFSPLPPPELDYEGRHWIGCHWSKDPWVWACLWVAEPRDNAPITPEPSYYLLTLRGLGWSARILCNRKEQAFLLVKNFVASLKKQERE